MEYGLWNDVTARSQSTLRIPKAFRTSEEGKQYVRKAAAFFKFPSNTVPVDAFETCCAHSLVACYG